VAYEGIPCSSDFPNTMQIVFADSTPACVWFKNGQAASNQILDENGKTNGIYFVDQDENWVIFHHGSPPPSGPIKDSGTVGDPRSVDHDGNFSVYEPDCVTPLSDTYMLDACGSNPNGDTCSWTNHGGDVDATGPEQGHLNAKGEYCGIAGVNQGNQTYGCYPNRYADPGVYDNSSTILSFGWKSPNWIEYDEYFPDGNPIAIGK
jgi:hypothetical protein